MTVDIRIETDEELRKRARRVCITEDMTYEELLEAMLNFRDDHRDLWDRRDDDEHHRRPTGGPHEG